MLIIGIDSQKKEIALLEAERDSMFSEPWPINEILDKTENINNEIFKLKQQLNESNTEKMCGVPSCKNHGRNGGLCRACKQAPLQTQL